MPPAWLDALEARALPAVPLRPEVCLRDYPVLLGVRQEARTVDLMREMQLIALDAHAGDGGTSVPRRLLDFAATISAEYGEALVAPRAELERAYRAGEPQTEIRYPLLPESPRLMLTYARLMEEADAYCAAGQLISLAPDAEVYALRRWTVEEFLGQYGGVPPRPWTQWSRETVGT